MSHRSDRHEQEAVFWCSLLQPLILEEVPRDEAATFLRQLADTEQLFPDGRRKKPSRATLWRKWKLYREGGFEALLRRRRTDRGRPRSVEQKIIDKAVELKKDQPRRSDETINQFLQQEFKTTLPKSTLYRHLKKGGSDTAEAGYRQAKGPPPLEPRSKQCLVGRRFRGRAVCHRWRPCEGNASLGLHRLPQPLHRRCTLLLSRKPQRAHRLLAPRMGQSRSQPRTVRGQRGNLSCAGTQNRLPVVEH